MPANLNKVFKNIQEQIYVLQNNLMALQKQFDDLTSRVNGIDQRVDAPPPAKEGVGWQKDQLQSATSGSMQPSTLTLKPPTGRKQTKN